ncbi:MAG: DinB family protein [Candidatus Latescibacterota bacterium]
MNWQELLRCSIEYDYQVTDKLLDLVDDDKLDWKPSPDNNWMNAGQLLMHIGNACGAGMKGFATGDWGMPEGMDMASLPAEEMLPPAEKMQAVGSVAEAKKLLAEDKQVALEMLASCSEEKLAREIATAPWDSMEMVLGQRFLQMLIHLASHRSQLFYYLKLQGKPVNTHHLWGG